MKYICNIIERYIIRRKDGVVVKFKLVEKLSTRTSTGVLNKGLYIGEDGSNYFVKGSSENGYESLAEVMAYKIANLLGIHVAIEYDLVDAKIFPDVAKGSGKPLCICRNFLRNGEIFRTVATVAESLGTTNTVDWLAFSNGLIGIENLRRMLFLDAIIGNKDRHLNNFGVIQGPYGSRFHIYDNGDSLLSGVGSKGVSTIYHDKSKPFRTTHYAQLKYVGLPKLSIRVNANTILEVISPYYNVAMKGYTDLFEKWFIYRFSKYTSMLGG
jgi:hypothetical protein